VRLRETPLAGVRVVEPELIEDDRGAFARTFDAAELGFSVAQCSTSFNRRAGTLRGLHWQADPHGEHKLVRCTAGAIFDVAVDLREGSATFHEWFGIELSAENRLALLVPPGCAHGFQTLTDGAEVFYTMDVGHQPGAARGARWDDPAFGVRWPEPPASGRVMSEADAGRATLG
jgi:dTDP-4-dehydrorhamnose 3,5-epimerase